jgi:hypothetical protein
VGVFLNVIWRLTERKREGERKVLLPILAVAQSL